MQTLVAAQTRERRIEEEVFKPRTRHQAEVAKPSLFSREAKQVVEFITACKLYIRMRMRDEEVEEQV